MATTPPITTLTEGETPEEVSAAEPESGAAAPCECESSETGLEFHLEGIDNRERALPVRQGDLNRLLLAEPGLSQGNRDLLAAFGRILGATFHDEFYEKLRSLKELYAPLDPDSDYIPLKDCTRRRSERSDEEFLGPFAEALVRANYDPLPLHVIEEAVAAPNEMGLTYVPDLSLFEHIEVWVRGYIRITRDCRSYKTRYLKRTAHFDAYQRLVVALKFKPDLKLGPHVRSDVLYLRMFKDVPHVDMEMHLPEQGTKVKMRWIDKAQIASPILMGIPTILMKLFVATLSTAAIGGLMIAPISAGVNSFFGFRRAKQRHLNAMIHRLYYLSLANNASVITRLIDSAEDEEFKEAMLAYFFLWRAAGEPSPLTVPALDARIEKFLRAKTGIAIKYEVGDAVCKLFRLGLVRRDAQGGLHVLPIDEALRVLDRQWDRQFRYNPEAR